MVKVERDGTLIVGVDGQSAERNGKHQTSFDLLPDPASLRDLAVRFRDDAATAPDGNARAALIAAAEEADMRAQAVEASALWTTPMRR